MRIAFAFAALSLIGLPGLAEAQPPGAGLPRDAVLVAGPTVSGARLFVRDEGRHLCASVISRGSDSETCGAAPERLREPLISVDKNGRGPDFVWGIVSPEVASVELVSARGRRVATDTTAGVRYHGKHAGELRFFLVEARWQRGDGLLYARLLDSNGALLAAVDTSSYGSSQRGRETQVARGRVARAPWSLRVFTRRELVPLPGDEERVVTERCVALALPSRFAGRHPQTHTDACDDPDSPRPVDIALARTCGPIGIQVAGLARFGVRLRAVLGDGSHLRVPLHALPPRFGPRRAFALPLAPTVALQSLVAIEDGRRHVELGGIGPGTVDCPDSSSGFLTGYDLRLPRFGSAPPALQLRDDGVLLCATLGLPDPERRDCARPPLDEEYSWILSRTTADTTTVAGVVPLTVGSVELVLAGGERHLVPTEVDSPYTGRYRGLIRVFSLTVPGGHEPRRVTLNGLDGKPITTIPIYSPPTFERAPQPLLRTRGGWTLGAGIIRFVPPDSGARRLSCLQLVRGEFSRNPFACTFPDTMLARVTCRPKRTLVFGRLAPGRRLLEIRTTHGTVVPKTASLRPLGTSGRAFVAELPGRAGLRSVVVRGVRIKRHRLRLPPANRQCGYAESLR